MTAVESRADSEKKYVEGYLEPLVGGSITAIGAIVEDDFGFPEVWQVLRVKLADGKVVDLVVSRDPEGNGPGHLFIEEIGPF